MNTTDFFKTHPALSAAQGVCIMGIAFRISERMFCTSGEDYVLEEQDRFALDSVMFYAKHNIHETINRNAEFAC